MSCTVLGCGLVEIRLGERRQRHLFVASRSTARFILKHAVILSGVGVDAFVQNSELDTKGVCLL